MLKANKIVLYIVIVLFANPAFTQSKKVLQEQKEKLENDIEYTNKLLEKTKKNKQKSLGYLNTLSKQLKNREELIQMLNIEIGLIDKQIQKNKIKINETRDAISAKQDDLKKIEEDYAKMIYHASKNKNSYDNWVFIFSSKSFNQAYKRLKYLKQYAQHRKMQAVLISNIKEQLLLKVESLQNHKIYLQQDKEKKKNLIDDKKGEVKDLEVQQTEKKEVINKLQKSEKYFKKELQKKQQAAKLLDEKIRKIIEEEIRKTRAKKKTKDGFELTPEAKLLSDSFLENKGKLPWPLDKGLIVEAFGKQKNAVFKDVETYNNGVDIATEEGAKVRTVFDGKISRIFLIKGAGKVILINHGEYFSVYSGLKEVSVKLGVKVYAKEEIGVVMTDEKKGKTQLHFEIWKNYDKQDPSLWLYKAH